jgi:GWxTD domain-containing protein
MYLWKAGQPGDERTYVVNPSRMYGLYRDSVSVFVEAYVPRPITYQDIEIKTVILDDQGERVTESSVVIPTAGEPSPDESQSGLATFPILITEDLNMFPAGKYSLYVSAAVRDDPLVRRLAGSFSVAWDMRTWEMARRNFILEAKFLLDDKDLQGFTEKSIGEQEAIVQAMWRDIDPDPSTGVNEAYEKYVERLAYVEARYSDYQLGVYSDRGLIYLKYGPPDERIVDVIPLNRESMSDALQKVEDRFHAVNFSNTGGRLGYATPQQNIIIDPRRLGAVGEGGDTAYPYELWVYNQSGDPIRKRDKVLEPDHGLRFIFIDREGYGRYRLESSSSMANK